MDTMEVKSAFEGLVAEVQMATELSQRLRGAVFEVYNMLKDIPTDDPRREMIASARLILLNALNPQ